MIVLEVSLIHSLTGEKSLIAHGVIINTGDSDERPEFGNYKFAFDVGEKAWRQGKFLRFPRTKKNVWQLIFAALMEATCRK
jgi:hypothetical protein